MRAQRRTAKGMLTAWQLWVRFQQAHRIHKQRSRRRTKDRRDELLVQAQQAADQGNTYGLWRIVKQLAPKAPRKRLQLHKEGNILSTSEELSWILEAYGERYGANTPATLKIENGQAAPHPIIHAPTLAWVLGRLNPRKAVPRGAAPSILWKACCREVAASVVGSINRNWMQSPPRITQGWSDATVALLPKPHGRMNSPLDLRPIGLQDPLGKGAMTLLLQQAREEIITLNRKYPQTAYLPGRGTSTALRQVFRHCHDIRDMGLGARLTVHQRQTGARPQQCCGGLQISLDLSAAFDLMRWTHLKQALDLAGTPVYLQDILLTWLIQVRYLFYHRDQEGTVTPRCGLRQGCTASPLLWSAFTSLICVTIEDKLGSGWTASHSTMYADDNHLRWKFMSFTEFERTMHEVRIVFHVFRLFHLKINIEKTKAILKVVGTMQSRVRKDHIRKHGQDNAQRLLLSPRDPETWLPLVTQTEYLGLIVSYGHFELQSLRHRVTKANGRRWAMASILHSKKLGIGYKLMFWRSCVLSIMTYGLHCCGLTGDGTQEAHRAQMRHVRAIVNNQAHLTGDTHAQIMQKYQIPHFADLLRQALDREERAVALQPDWMWDEEWNAHVRQQLNVRTDQPDQEDEAAIWSCPKCEASFVSAAALKTHARRTHGITEEHPTVFNKAVHSEGGVPTCSGCHKKFSRWQTLAQHIDQNSCPGMIRQPEPVADKTEFMHMPDDTVHEPVLCRRPEVVQASLKGINAFIPLKHITRSLRQTCGLCGQWCTSHKTVKRHYYYSHHDLLHSIGQQNVIGLVNRTATASPTCHYCGTSCKDWREHLKKCTVAWQCSVLVLRRQDGLHVRGSGHERVLRGGQRGTHSQKATPGGEQQGKQQVRASKGQDPPVRGIGQYFNPARNQAGGRTSGFKAGPLVHAVYAAGQGHSIDFSISDGQSVQEEAGGVPHVGSGLPATPSGPLLSPLPRTGYASRGSGEGRQQDQGDCGPRVDDSRLQMEVSSMEPRAEAPAGGQDANTPHNRRDQAHAGEVVHGHQDGRCHSIQLHQEAHGDHGDPGHLLLRPVMPQPRTGGMGHDDTTAGQLCPAVDRAGIQAGRTTSGSDGSETSRSPQCALRLVLGNLNQNTCYMNSFVQVLLWSLTSTSGQFTSLGSCAYFFQQLGHHDPHKVKHLSKDFFWRTLIAGWTNSHQQQDVAEFASFLCKKHKISLVAGEWEARTYIHGVGHPGDAGLSAQPILLHLPSLPPGLSSTPRVQSLVDQWYAQEAIHAFTVLPSVLMLQLGRFRVQQGQIHKIHTHVQVDEWLWIPHFLNANFQVRPIKYERIAVICHHGEHPRSGHYQAMLHSHDCSWSCDDNRSSHLCSDMPIWHSSSCYLLFYKRAVGLTPQDDGTTFDTTHFHVRHA